MPFSALLGNARIKDNLTAALQQGKLAHFYLISGPVGFGKKTLARLLAAAAMCENPDKPCGKCPHCRKALASVHPDVIWVEDAEHKAVPVRLIRQMREDIFIRPNEAERKVYIFPQEMGLEGQNALLKVLEEPPAYGLFLLLAENPEKILPTVRSRCVELKMQALPPEMMKPALLAAFPQAERTALDGAIARSGGALGQAMVLLADNLSDDPRTADFVAALCGRDTLTLARTLVPMEKLKRDALIPLLQRWTALTEEALAQRCGGQSVSALSQTLAQARNASDLSQIVARLQKCCAYAMSNVSPAAVCGYLLWHLC